MSDNILNLADNVRFIASSANGQINNDEVIGDIVSSLSFGNPSDIMFMAQYFGFDKNQLRDTNIAEKLKNIYGYYQKFDIPLFDFINDIGGKLGGRFSTDSSTFLDKFFTYISLRNDESNTEKRLEVIKKARSQLEVNQEVQINENSDYISG